MKALGEGKRVKVPNFPELQNGLGHEICRKVLQTKFGNTIDFAHPCSWISLTRALMIPTKVQLNNEPVKKEMPLLRVSPSIFWRTFALIACENKEAEILSRVFG